MVRVCILMRGFPDHAHNPSGWFQAVDDRSEHVHVKCAAMELILMGNVPFVLNFCVKVAFRCQC